MVTICIRPLQELEPATREALKMFKILSKLTLCSLIIILPTFSFVEGKTALGQPEHPSSMYISTLRHSMTLSKPTPRPHVQLKAVENVQDNHFMPLVENVQDNHFMQLGKLRGFLF